MTRIYRDTEVTRTGTFRNSSGVLTDPDTVTFEYRHQREHQWRSATPVKDTTGVYDVTFTPEYSGLVFTRWKGEGTLNVTLENTLLVERTAFERNAFTKDYCNGW